MHPNLRKKIIPWLFISVVLPYTRLFANDVSIKILSDQGIVIEFLPQSWQINTECVKGKSYLKVHFDNASVRSAPGEPQIPERIFMVGIPHKAKVTFELLKAEKFKILEGMLIPTPMISDHGLAEFEYQEDSTFYQEQKAVPQDLVKISPPAIVRHQRVVMVSLYPVQFSPDRKQVCLYNRLVVRINFLGGQNNQMLTGQVEDDFSLHNQLVINSIQAAKWQEPGTRGPAYHLKKRIWGELYKIWLREEGIYQIRGVDLKAGGINLREVKPYRIKLFNNGGLQLPQSLDQERADRLIENAIVVIDGGDGSFDPEDYILFYGKSVSGWSSDPEEKYSSHYLNAFTLDNVYWLSYQDPDSGKRMIQKKIIETASVIKVTDFYDHIYVENEHKNLFNSGTVWLGDYFSSATLQRHYLFDLRGVLPDKQGLVRVNLVGISQGEHRFQLYLNDSFLASVPIFWVSNWNQVSIKMKEFQTPIAKELLDGYNRLTIEYQPSSDLCQAYLDWIEFSFYRQLTARDDQLFFYSPDSVGIYHYYLDSFSTNDIQLYDISCFSDVSQLEIIQRQDGAVEFIDTTNSVVAKKYLAINPNRFKSPLKIELDISSDLRNTGNWADFIIITHNDFYDAALALKSLRENCDRLKTEVIKISDVYDEFSWGLVDPTAIRDFIKYAYEHWQKPPSYILLLGDGDYDYKNIISHNDLNWIPPYETSDLDELSSRARDDWYVCIDGNDDLMDIAIGRIPVRNPDEAMQVVQKIISYENSPTLGEWCNTITMVADDEYGQGGGYDVVDHVPDAENIVENFIPESYNIQKIYLNEYPAVQDASIAGIRKPAAHEELIKQINQGSLIINFIGHGNEKLWTHERVFASPDDLSRLQNGAKQAFWIAATCNFARFDNPNQQSFAEQLITMPDGGAIAVFSACRLASAAENVNLNRAILQSIFNNSKPPYRLGDAVLLAKNSVMNNPTDQSYHLLGDPTLRLMMPSCQAQITSYSPDSLRALSHMYVSGILQSQALPSTTLQGQILFKAYDSRKERAYQVREWKTWHYKLAGNVIFRGTATVTAGGFKTQFFVPKDITYGGKEGRFSVFYWNDQFFGSGCLDGIYVGGTQAEFKDDEGPIITIGFAGQNFKSGDLVSANPILELTIIDTLSGINIAGDIGHKITLVLADTLAEQIELNDFFHYDHDNYQMGQISYPLAVTKGKHHLQVKAWDNCNNSSFAEAEFTVVSLDELIISDLLNYPNPFSHGTEFIFQANQNCEVTIKIYTVSGRLICKLDGLRAEAGFNHFYWDGLDRDGDPLANGVYLYKVLATGQNGYKKFDAEKIEKCVILR